MNRVRWLTLMALLLSAWSSARVIVAGGAITETVYAIGAGEALLAVDSTSRWPAAARALPDIGYLRQLSTENILALGAERLILDSEAGPPAVIARLQQVLPVVLLPSLDSPAALPARVQTIAELFERPQAGAALAAELQRQLNGLAAQREQLQHRRALVLLAGPAAAPLVAGRDTPAQGVLDWLGMTNVAASVSGYKPLSAEAPVLLAPEVVIVAETHAGAFDPERWPLLRQTPALLAQRLLVTDAQPLLGMGPRLPQALAAIMRVAGVAGSASAQNPGH